MSKKIQSPDILHFRNLCDNLIDSFSLVKDSNFLLFDNFLKNVNWDENEKCIINNFLNLQTNLNWFYFVNCARSLRDYLININSFHYEVSRYIPNFKGKASKLEKEVLNKFISFLKSDNVLKCLFYSIFIFDNPIKEKEDAKKFIKKIKELDFYSLFLHYDKYSINFKQENIMNNVFILEINRYDFGNNSDNSYFMRMIDEFNEMIKNTPTHVFKNSIEKLFNEFITISKLKIDTNVYYGLNNSKSNFLLKEIVRIIKHKEIT